MKYYISTNGGAYSLFDTEPVGTQSINTASLVPGSYSFEAQYLGDGNYPESPMSAPEPLTINQGSTSVSTAISDSGGGVVTSVLGEKVYDTATVTGTPAAFAPTGNVKYYFSTDGGTTYSMFDTEPVGAQSINTSSLAAGSYSFEAQYLGDGNYQESPMSAPEPLTINQGSTSVSTAISDSGGGVVTSVLGEKVYDTATVTGTPAAFAPTGTVTYDFYDTATPIYGSTTPVSTQTVTLSGGLVPNSAATASLTAGSYSFIGVYSGDSNYPGYTTAVEPLTINQGASSVSTAIFDAPTGSNVVVVDAAWATKTTGATVVYGGNTYTVGTNAFATIQAGVNSAAAATVGTAGGTVLVVAGTYTESVDVQNTNGHLENNVTIQASGVVTLDGGFIVQNHNYPLSGGDESGPSGVTIDGFDIVGGAAYDTYHDGIFVYATGTTIENNVIENVTVGSQSNGIEVVAGSSGLTVEGNVIAGNWRGMYLNPTSGVTITYNYIHDNNGGGDVGIGSSGLSNFLLEYNTIADNSAEGWGIDTVGVNVKAEYNNFTGNGLAIDDWEGTNNNITAENNWWGNATGPGVGGANPVGLFGVATSTTTPIDWTNPATTPFSSAMAVTNVLGQQVYDTATVSGTPAAFAPTGYVNYYISTDGGTTYSLFDTEPVGTQSLDTASLPAGSYSFEAQYLGDGNYQESPMSAPEPLTITQGTSSVSTAISDSGGGAVTSVLGEKVYDTATVSGTPAAFTPTGNVNYYLSTNGGAYSLFDTEPVGTQSLNTASLAAGSYSFEAQYLGDGNYQQSPMSAPESLTINQGSSSVSTAISDSSGEAVTNVLGEQVYDTATVTGTPAAFTPTGYVQYYMSTDGGDIQRVWQRGAGRDSVHQYGVAAGGQLLVRGPIPWRRQLPAIADERPRAVDDQPGQLQRVDRDLRLRRRGGQQRAGREGLRHGDGDRHAGGLRADRQRQILLLDRRRHDVQPV